MPLSVDGPAPRGCHAEPGGAGAPGRAGQIRNFGTRGFSPIAWVVSCDVQLDAAGRVSGTEISSIWMLFGEHASASPVSGKVDRSAFQWRASRGVR